MIKRILFLICCIAILPLIAFNAMVFMPLGMVYYGIYYIVTGKDRVDNVLDMGDWIIDIPYKIIGE